jgi:hypothetical protein
MLNCGDGSYPWELGLVVGHFALASRGDVEAGVACSRVRYSWSAEKDHRHGGLTFDAAGEFFFGLVRVFFMMLRSGHAILPPNYN